MIAPIQREFNDPQHFTECSARTRSEARRATAYNYTTMLRWVIALLSAYFVLAFGASAHCTTAYGTPQSSTAHSIAVQVVVAHVHEMREASSSNTDSPTTSLPSAGTELLLQALDDLAVDLPDLLNPPDALHTEAALRVRMMDQRLIAPHSPSLKRKPKPPRLTVELA